MSQTKIAFSGITREQLRKWGGAEILTQAIALVNSGDVQSVEYDPNQRKISGKIERSNGYAMPVAFYIENENRIRSECPCIQSQRYGMICEHVVALGLAQMLLEAESKSEPPAKRTATVRRAPTNARTPAPTTTAMTPPATPESDYITVPAVPKFYAYIIGSDVSLAIELDAWYGEIDFPACSLQNQNLVWMEDPDDPLIRRVRSLKAEQAAKSLLEQWGFQPGYRTGDVKYYLTDRHKLHNFLGSGLPELRRRRDWRVDLSPQLGALVDSFGTIAPLVEIHDLPNGDFSINYSFTAYSENDTAEIPAVEIQAALNRGDGYLRHNGKITLMDAKAIESMHAIFNDVADHSAGNADGSFRVRAIHSAYVKASLDEFGIEYDDAAAPTWREIAAERNREHGDAHFEPVALGPLESVLRPYQKQGVYWMCFLANSGFNGLLADEMGLGKTLQTLCYLSLIIATERKQSAAHRPALIVCPTSLVRNWESEAAKFTPWLKTLVLSGPERADDFARIDQAELVVTSYALLQRDLETAYAERRFAAVVLDEAQRIKNRNTRNARAVKSLLADRRLVLTGTPVENSVADVWSIFDFLMPNYLGDYENFKLAYEEPINVGGDDARSAQARLKRKIHPFILRRLKKTVAQDLPDKLVKISYCPVPEDVQREYNAILQKERGGAKTRFQMLALLMKLRQIASRGKIDAFMDTLEEAISGGHRVLVFSQFVKQLSVLADVLRENNVPFCYLDGSTKDRIEQVNRFQRNPDIPVFLISLMAGGTGLTLTGADMVIHYDPWWNPAVEDQATDRAHRIGQKKQVYVIKLIAADTIEEKVLALQRRKQAVIAATVNTTDTQIMEKLSEKDLAELLN